MRRGRACANAALLLNKIIVVFMALITSAIKASSLRGDSELVSSVASTGRVVLESSASVLAFLVREQALGSTGDDLLQELHQAHAGALSFLLELLATLHGVRAYQPLLAELQATTYRPEAILKCFKQLVAHQQPSRQSERGVLQEGVPLDFPSPPMGSDGWPLLAYRRAPALPQLQRRRLPRVLHLTDGLAKCV